MRVVLALLLVLGACGGPEQVTAELRPYGEEPTQFAELSIPEGRGPFPVVVLIHGGFWTNRFDLGGTRPIGADLLQRGWAVWNVEYRRVGDPGGGWPATFNDVAAAIDALDGLDGRLDLDQVTLVGHSSGGHLALWAAGRAELPEGVPGAMPVVIPQRVIALAPVADLYAAAEAGLGRGAVSGLLGGLPAARPDRYALASPLLDLGVRTVVVVADDDRIVPRAFSVLDTMDSDVIEVAGDHFSLINPDEEAWDAVIAVLGLDE